MLNKHFLTKNSPSVDVKKPINRKKWSGAKKAREITNLC